MDDCIYMYLQVWWKTNDRISITILLLNIKDIQRLVFFAGQPYMMKPAVYVYIYIYYSEYRVSFGSPARMDVQKAEHL